MGESAGAQPQPDPPDRRPAALSLIHAAAPGRVAVYGAENHAGTPVYVHAKVCVIDDEWASVGSDNFNRRSWTHDSELSAVVWDTAQALGGGGQYARDLRLALAREHLDDDQEDSAKTAEVFETFARSAARLQAW